MTTKTLTVTFDTNVFNPIVDCQKRSQADALTYEGLENAIRSGHIIPFASDAIATIEGIPRKSRSLIHQNKGYTVRVRTGTISPDGAFEEDGEIVRHKGSPPPPLPVELMNRISSAAAMGFKFISMPRIVHGKLAAELYKEETDKELSIRLSRVSTIHEALEARGMGSGQIKELSRVAIANDPKLARAGQMGAAAHLNHKHYAAAVGEWADGDAISAHYAFNHDVFCTLDEGGGAGTTSVLHKSHRQWLSSQFQIKICSPTELVAMITH